MQLQVPKLNRFSERASEKLQFPIFNKVTFIMYMYVMYMYEHTIDEGKPLRNSNSII